MANKRDSLGDRMKNNYENRSKTYLIRRMPVIIRLDGKAFHTFTKGMVKPFDKRLMETMQETTLALCDNIMGCVLGYTQSDEITLVLVDYNNIDTEAWYDYAVQKIASVSASLCTFFFNKIFQKKVYEFIKLHQKVVDNPETYGEELSESVKKLINVYSKAVNSGAFFDARVFNMPKEEVANCVLWRQQDASRNSVSSLAQAHFSHKELQGKNSSQMQDMLMDKFGINWNNLSTTEKRGTAIIKNSDNKWFIDTEMPILKGDDRKYIENLINIGE
jgi:tRNA(His) 5'-end guanylyltransferase